MIPPAGGHQARFHAFLRRLRAKGRSNMYGAVPYLMRAFALDRDCAFRVVCDWLDAQEGDAATDTSGPQRLPRRTARARSASRTERGTTS